MNPLEGIPPYDVLLRPLSDGNTVELDWVVANAPPGYWTSQPSLIEDIVTKIVRPISIGPRLSKDTIVRAITMLKQAGAPTESDEFGAFRESYKVWLATQLPDDLRTLVRHVRFSIQWRPRPGDSDFWKTISDALALTCL
jgi:hypothetical protein